MSSEQPKEKSGKLIKINPRAFSEKNERAAMDHRGRLLKHFQCEASAMIMAVISGVYQASPLDREIQEKLRTELFPKGIPKKIADVITEFIEAMNLLLITFDHEAKTVLKSDVIKEKINSCADEAELEESLRGIVIGVKTRVCAKILGKDFLSNEFVVLNSQPFMQEIADLLPDEPDQSPSADR